ncbi:MAG: ATP-grasp domain-containing protein [Acidobacteria bacterium]|nr:ATP-grasp domain-containing protein [Acidobacteriota bacterium]MBS1865824.1 ATP-grasp domain-containing protein [Acidobacteriota bacterium]
MAERPLTILCVTSYEKGQEFLRTCKHMGCRVLLLTVEKLRNGDWPRDAIDEMFFMPEELPLAELINAVSYTARNQKIDRIVALDEFDMENVSALREHLRIPGMGLTTVRYFRDKLAMRARAKEEGILVPEFVHVLNHNDLREFMATVPGPWLLKPRSQASGIGMKKIHAPEELWPWLERLGDDQSSYLLEQFIPGSVFHVDSVVSEREVLFAEAHAYGAPPLDVSHGGGVFTTRTLPRETAETLQLKELNRELMRVLGLMRGVTHAEFLKAHGTGKIYFLEIAARVGGAYISDVIETATGINLWREWAKLEVGAGKTPYELPPVSRDYAGVILSLARQEKPDTSAYNDSEISYRVKKYHHAGFILKSPREERVRELLDSYAKRFVTDFVATQPVPDKPTS